MRCKLLQKLAQFRLDLKFNISKLKVISILYLAFPYFIFFLGWLKIPFAIFFTGVLATGLYVIFSEKTKPLYNKISAFQLLIISVIILLWLLFSGAGGFGYQNHDYYKHNALLKDLMDQKWPVSYQLEKGQKFLSHYLAYYLPGPALFYGLGWKYVNLANFIFTSVGVFISVFWMLRFVGKFSYWVVLVFILGSGAHIFVLLYTHGAQLSDFLLNNIQNHKYLFWLNCLSINNEPINTINFMSVTDMLYWGPQHAIGAWLGIGLLLNDWLDKNIKYSPFYISIIAFWAPLVLIGLAPFLLFVIISLKFKGIFNLVNFVVAPIIFGLIGLFLTSIKTNELLHHFLLHDRSSFGISTLQQITAYLYFIAVEVLIWWLPSYLILRKTALKKYNGIFWMALVVLLTVPLFRYGQWNDWCTRASLPSLYIIYCMLAMAIIYAKNLKTKLLLVTISVVCAVSPVSLIAASIKFNNYTIKWTPPPAEFIGDLPSASVGFPVEQFVADPDCFFYKYLAKTK